MAMSDEDYRHVTALNDEQRELENRLGQALAAADSCKRRIAAIERARHVLIWSTNSDHPMMAPGYCEHGIGHQGERHACDGCCKKPQ